MPEPLSNSKETFSHIPREFNGDMYPITSSEPFENPLAPAPSVSEHLSADVVEPETLEEKAEPEAKKPFIGKLGSNEKSAQMKAAVVGGVLIIFVGALWLTHLGSPAQAKKTNNLSGPTPGTSMLKPPDVVAQNDIQTQAAASGDVVTPDEILKTKGFNNNQPATKGSFSVPPTGGHIVVGDHPDSGSSFPSGMETPAGSASALSTVAAYPAGSGHWQPPPPGAGYAGDAGYGGNGSGYGSYSGGRQGAPKPSMTFVTHGVAVDKVGDSSVFPSLHPNNFGLPIGYKVQVRLESVATTAVKVPVIAVVEYPITKDGEVVIPAGAKFIGTISDADRSGNMGFAFTRLVEPDGTTIKVEAVALDKNQNALKGDVTGKNTGTRIALGFASGLGSIAPIVVGGNNLSGAYSAGDQIREQEGQNIGNAGNEAVQSLARQEHVVVTMQAGTKFYAVFVSGGDPQNKP